MNVKFKEGSAILTSDNGKEQVIILQADDEGFYMLVHRGRSLRHKSIAFLLTVANYHLHGEISDEN